MNYLLFCLVIRTAYLGKQFEFMQNEMRKPEIETIEELIQENYTLYIFPESVKGSLRGIEFMSRWNLLTL
jgi:hypothetical protein